MKMRNNYLIVTAEERKERQAEYDKTIQLSACNTK
jgi:hypothetical protein